MVEDDAQGEADRDHREGRPRGYVASQMVEVAIPKNLFADILRMIAELRLPSLISAA